MTEGQYQESLQDSEPDTNNTTNMDTHVEFVVGFDLEGDSCIYLQLIDNHGNFVRYLNEQECIDFMKQTNCFPHQD